MAKESFPSDEELVRAAQSGALEAFTALYERYLSVVYRRVHYKVPEQDVEDVTQEIFIKVMKSLKQFRYEAQFSTWLRTLTNRQIADYYRKRKQPETHLNPDILHHNLAQNSTPHHADDLENIHDMVVLQGAFRQLPVNYQEILLLRFVDCLKFIEIAQLQGQSLEATKSLYRRAVAMLRKRVTNE
jgi:RNA polymerase sigma-70 factor (ECF subfamily)